jgi:hypothetical protein
MAFGTTITVPTVTGSHNDFSAVIVCNGARNDLPSGAYNGANEILNGGGNLRAYTDSSKTTQLPVEIVSFVTGASPQIEVWIKLPAGNPMVTAATIYIEADTVETAQPAVTNAYGRNAVWTDFGAVWHLDSLIDSTGNGNDLTAGGDPTGGSAGQVGDAYLFDSDDRLTTVNDATLRPTSAVALSLWAKVTTPSASLNGGVVLGSLFGGASEQCYELDFHAGEARATLVATGDDRDRVDVAISDSSFHRWGLRYDNTDLLLTKDGVTGATIAKSGDIDYGAADSFGLTISARSGGTFGIDGILDEIRIQTANVGNIDDDRETTEYNNQFATTAWFTNDGWADSGGGLTISPSTIDSSNAFDITNIIVPPVIGLTQIDSTNLFDISSINHPELIELSPVDSANDIPSPTITMPQLITLDAIDSLNMFSIAGITGGLIIRAGSLVSSSIRSGSFSPSRTASIQ